MNKLSNSEKNGKKEMYLGKNCKKGGKFRYAAQEFSLLFLKSYFIIWKFVLHLSPVAERCSVEIERKNRQTINKRA